ncbi:hypothetical protein [Kibdelosporangium phytohabitans]|uniref:Uncharacterized protein n=1 Tax=Kibdelosporangium phytohabitans TaxID=860235 RepID=A0A0N9HUK6_9PSEU|nr:hypothetical protein [Kibdelosporangium phytohabitans]ALG05780.1 hypothetical protein AOZ06_01540 [Kibdelosporangium phytohabitans]MBE1466215.1 hypothetical protein [Kibdelosporangium phytohabitans]
MSATEVVNRFGVWTLAKLVLALLVFLALHLARWPLLVLARLLEMGMSGVDRLVTAAVTSPPRPGEKWRDPLRHNT